MSPRTKFGEEVSVSREKKFQIMGTWMPVTPKKSIPVRSSPVAIDRHERPLARENWQEMAGLPVGNMQEMLHYNHSINHIQELPIYSRGVNHIQELPNYSRGINHIQELPNHSRSINHIQELPNFSRGVNHLQELPNYNRGTIHLQELLNYNGGVHNLNPVGQVTQSEGYCGGRNIGVAERSGMINQIAASYRPALHNNSAGWNVKTVAELLAINNAAAFASPNKTQGRSTSMANAPLIPGLQSQVSSWRDSDSTNLVHNQIHFGSNPLSNSSGFQQISQACAGPSITTTLPISPVTPDRQLKKLANNQVSMTVNFSMNEISTPEKDKQETSVMPIGNEGTQLISDEFFHKDMSSSAISTALEEKKDLDNGGDQGIDLNKTPQQKPPKRKKVRPKVFVEKPKKTEKKTPGEKRRYTRKKDLKESANQPEDVLRETTDPSAEPPAKSCRRSLNFDFEKSRKGSQSEVISHLEEMQQRHPGTFNLNLDSQATELTNRISGTKSTMLIGHQNNLPTVNQQPGIVNTNTLSMNQILVDNISIPERHAVASSPLARKDPCNKGLNVIASNVDTKTAQPCQKSSRNGNTHIQQHINAKGIGETVSPAETIFGNFEKTRVIFSTIPQSQVLSSLKEARGFKRRYGHAIEQTHPHTENSMGSSLLYQDIFQMNGCHQNSNIVGVGSNKNNKIENGRHTNINSNLWGTDAIKCCSHQVQTKRVNHINGSSHQIGDGEVVKRLIDWDPQSMAYEGNLPNQIHSKQHLSAEKLRETIGLTSIPDSVPLMASERCNLLQPTRPGKAPSPADRLARKTCHTNGSAKQNVKCNLGKSTSSGRDQMQSEHGEVLQDHLQYSAKIKGLPNKQIYPISMDEIINKFKALNLNRTSGQVQEQVQNAIVPYNQDGKIVPYKQDGTIVPYEGFDFIKKRKPRPKVDLDPETNRIWSLLMGKEGSEGLEGMDEEKEKWWEEERKVFQGRANSFIARMHLVQGDRRFSKWKGSVVDSVIGVFLTQNVSDHLSSSAFMSLAARFPLKSNNKRCNIDGTNISVEEPEVCMPSPNVSIQWNEQVLRNPLCGQNAITPHELTERQRERNISGIEKTSLLEAHSHSLEEEVVSSQDSFSSSILQGSGGIKSSSGSNSEAEDPISGCRPKQVHGSTHFLQVRNAALFQDLNSCINVNSLFQEGYGNGHKSSNDTENSQQDSRLDSMENFGSSLTFTQLLNFDDSQNQVPLLPSPKYQPQMNWYSEVLESSEICSGDCLSSWHSTDSGYPKGKDSRRNGQLAEDVGETTVQQNGLPISEEMPPVRTHAKLSKQSMPQQNISQPGSQKKCNQQNGESMPLREPINHVETLAQGQNSTMQNVPNCREVAEKTFHLEKRVSAVNKVPENTTVNPNSKEQALSKAYGGANPSISKSKKGKIDAAKKNTMDWDMLRKQVLGNGKKKERPKDTIDSLDYEAVRCAHVDEISKAIKERGMNNMLAERIQDFLNRIAREHGSIDLEWLRDVPPDKAKDYLLSIRGLGLKSVECVRLLTLHHLAFPVDTNVGRIAVRLGWVPLQPLPESLQLHLLELYPILESIQKYLWPRLCKLDQRTLYELHYQLITFGKVFCTKSKPNCNACPMRGECRHFASAFASARLALPGPEEKSMVSSTIPTTTEQNPAPVFNPVLLPPPEEKSIREAGRDIGKCEPIIEEPATPEPELTEISASDIEDTFYEDPDEIPTIKLNIEEFTVNVQNFMQKNMELQEGDMSKALVALDPDAASIPAPKLKNVSRLRTEHQVYELPDSHPLLKGMDGREPDDPSPYLLAIWTPGETADSIQPPGKNCGSQESGKLCNEMTCFSCNSMREANSQTVRGTLLIPCRTAMRGSFPLNGTYFQVNEMFADHESSLNPIHVPREWVWNLPRRTVYFGTSVSSIFKGLTTEGIQYCFWRGFVCVRGFDQKTRAPRPLMARLHFPASKLTKAKIENKR
ncbi:transcriptional activator DEMETER-like isoform X2 [Mangifera indica]|uniref:transcriptional activator DEMETER-like isoform X2 n=1 Tax=Mangifera indica TaxID=29780 RepID=UPI001CFB5DBA|nr:transcriptional activator DEMETER-like isoform X2 [Mangifera indica]